MTQHTETATPNRYAPGYEVDESSRGIRLVMDQVATGDFMKFSDHDRIVAALRLELSAERDAVAQYIGERNELQRLADMLILCGEDEAVEQKHPADKLRALIDKKITLRTQLAQAQNEALEDAAIQLKMALIKAGVYGDFLDWGSQKITRWQDALLWVEQNWKSPNSAEGEPG